MSVKYPRLPLSWSDDADHLFKISQALNGVLNGQINNARSVELAPGAASTELVDPLIHPNTVALLVPKSSSAASASYYLSPQKGKLTINHDVSAATDRIFDVLLFG